MSEMTSRERVRAIIRHEPADRVGFWLGNPHGDTWPIYYNYFGTTDQTAIRRLLGDDYLWVCPELFPGSYRHPAGKPMFGTGVKKTRHGAPGPFADCEDPREVDDYEWPKAEYVDFTACLERAPQRRRSLSRQRHVDAVLPQRDGSVRDGELSDQDVHPSRSRPGRHR